MVLRNGCFMVSHFKCGVLMLQVQEFYFQLHSLDIAIKVTNMFYLLSGMYFDHNYSLLTFRSF